jgi:hypothetical protein
MAGILNDRISAKQPPPPPLEGHCCQIWKKTFKKICHFVNFLGIPFKYFLATVDKILCLVRKVAKFFVIWQQWLMVAEIRTPLLGTRPLLGHV